MHAVLYSLALLSTSIFGQTSASQDEAALRSIANRQADAWNRGDGVAWAADFTDDAEFTNIRGSIFRGREAIVRVHTTILQGVYRGTHTEAHIRHITFADPNTAILALDLTVNGVTTTPPGIQLTAPGTLATHMMYVASRSHAGEWKIIFGQNTAVFPDPAIPQPR